MAEENPYNGLPESGGDTRTAGYTTRDRALVTGPVEKTEQLIDFDRGYGMADPASEEFVQWLIDKEAEEK
ncbi:MAG: hypothetical protein ABH817_01090 [archaeon]